MDTREFIGNIKVTISDKEVRVWLCNKDGCQFRFKAVGKVIKSGNDIMVMAKNGDKADNFTKLKP